MDQGLESNPLFLAMLVRLEKLEHRVCMLETQLIHGVRVIQERPQNLDGLSLTYG